MTNVTRVLIGDTWATILTTWVAEPNSWAEIGSFIDNNSKISSSITNVSKPA